MMSGRLDLANFRPTLSIFLAFVLLLAGLPSGTVGAASAQAASVATMSQPRTNATAVTIGDRVVFGGGSTVGAPSGAVDIFDATTQTWTAGRLSAGRDRLQSIVVGDKVLFFGGIDITGRASPAVDIFDAVTRTWTASLLSRPWPTTHWTAQDQPQPVVAGEQVVFVHADIADIYDVSAGMWRHHTLDVARTDASVVAVGQKVLIAGGEIAPGVPSDSVDLFDAATSAWSTTRLSRARTRAATAAVAGKAIVAGGVSSGAAVPEVDVYDAATSTWSLATLSSPGIIEPGIVTSWPIQSIVVGNRALFRSAARTNGVSIYDATSDVWSTPLLNAPVYGNPMLVGKTVAFVNSGNIALYDSMRDSWSWTPFTGDRSRGYSRTTGVAFATETKLIIAGGTGPQRINTVPYELVEILDVPTLTWTRQRLGQAWTNPATGIVGGQVVLATGAFLSHYDPSSGLWQTDTIPTARFASTGDAIAATVAGPYALVAGGVHSSSPNSIAPWDVPGVTDAVDLWDSRSGQWTSARLSQARRGIRAVSLGSLAIFAGGADSWGGAYSDVVEVYDNSTAGWLSSRAPAPISADQPLTLGTAVLFRGAVASNMPMNAFYAYDVVADRWQTVILAEPRFGVTAVGVGTVAVIAGGTREQYYGHSNVVDLFDASTGQQWTARLSEARTHMSAAVVGSRALFVGGTNVGPGDRNSMRPSGVVDIYEADADTWRTMSLPEPRWLPMAPHQGIAVVGSKALFVAASTREPFGDKNRNSSHVQIYDAMTDRWSTAPLSEDRRVLDVAVVGSKVVFAGGSSRGSPVERPMTAVDVYDDSTGRWSTSQRPVARGASHVTVLPGRAIFTASRETDKDFSVEVYEAATDSWSILSLPSGARDATVAAVGSKVFFAGGALVSSTAASEESWKRISVPAVDILDTETGAWDVTMLTSERRGMIPATVGTRALFAGGGGNIDQRTVRRPSALVDIFDVASPTAPMELPGFPR